MTDGTLKPAAEGEHELWQLGAFAGTGLATDHDHLMIRNGLGDLLGMLENRQIEVELRP